MSRSCAAPQTGRRIQPDGFGSRGSQSSWRASQLPVLVFSCTIVNTISIGLTLNTQEQVCK